ncbi:PqqD family peptide modification chaperone [Microbacterium sp.]|uniref:PqqD family peptide modification chaperone n=1 Tax=Microbacterium sp. TaxID=51671 RepID=UPI00281144A9|nr:PqqD family peptide modification chaperone [Microbacterium sp.]
MVSESAGGLRVGPDVAWVSSEQRAVVLNLADPGATPMALEGSAAAIWEAIAAGDGLTREELLATLAEAFGVAESDIAADVDAALGRFRELSLLG